MHAAPLRAPNKYVWSQDLNGGAWPPQPSHPLSNALTDGLAMHHMCIIHWA